MQTNHKLPVIGAAMYLPDLPQYIDWLVGGQRDLELQDPSWIDYLDHDWHAQAEAGRKLLTDHGYRGRLGIHAAFDALDLGAEDKLIRKVVETRYLQSLEFGAIVGATHMVIHSPFVAFGSALVNFTPKSNRQRIIDSVHATLERVLPVAERQQCILVIENIRDKNPQPLLDLVRSFNSDYVRLSIDTGHAAIMERDGGAPPHQWVTEAGDLLAHVHVQDLDGHDDRHWAVGEGDLNWRAFFRAINALNHQPRLCIEVNDMSDIARSAAWLEQQGLAC